ncbi:Beta-lactamase/transpeptidase-like protein [Akanthomyces lecanii RCEF 1005]|uniref:Beta-lactamase/transpeptidase-like protein n=1 Tax=Akanthomyces lecanii RCEF 1005 TaxID=1081108 RepID=A0A168I5K4_CORDF|nr:Beta-lactamase/transpeptidase-like protein [Akanthomyces lecanii RCEF 1005]
MKPNTITQRLSAALPIIRDICNISGVPAASIGVIHKGQTIYLENIGYRNVADQLSPTADTLYGLGSLTKGFVAASLAQLLLQHPSVTWTTPLQDIWPEYHPQQPGLNGDVSLVDFLSHRTGLSGDMSVALQGDMEFLLQPSEVAPTVSQLDVAAPLRQSWLYNNWGYSVAGTIIEKLSGKPAHQYIRESILLPLGLFNTTMRPILDQHTDFADAYTALENATTYCLPRNFPFLGSLFETAGGMYSTINDMLKYCQALLQSQIDPRYSPLSNLDMLFQGHIPLDTSVESYGSYGMGWIETHLPGVVGLQGDNAELFPWDELPYINRPQEPTKSIRTFYHQGAGIGYYSAIYLFPETETGFVVLTNSMPLNDAADWIAQVIAAAIHGLESSEDYVELAKESRRRKVGKVATMMAELEKTRKKFHDVIPRPVAAYCGDYYNALGNFYVHIEQRKDNSGVLEVLFQGKDTQRYELRHLNDDIFEWALSYDEQARRARFTAWEQSYFNVAFQFNTEGNAIALKWGGGQLIFTDRFLVLAFNEWRVAALKPPASLTPQFAAMTGIEEEDLAMEGNFIESTNGRKQPWKDFIHEACQSEHIVPVLENDLYCNICGKMKDDKGNCGCTGFLTA